MPALGVELVRHTGGATSMVLRPILQVTGIHAPTPMFALHYVHDYYAASCHGRKAGLQFPDDEQPDYGDFFYFASVIGTSGQTADVSFVSKPLRRIGSIHCILAYLFNTTVLALLINIGASMF